MEDERDTGADDWSALPDDPVEPGRILVVDNNLRAGENCAFALAKVGGHHVRVIQSPTEAREIALAWGPDVILLDIEMPEMNGFRLADLLIEDHSDADLMFVTRRKNTNDKTRGLRITEHYITKPFHPAILLETVNAILRRRRRNASRGAAPLDTSGGRLILDQTTHSVTNPPHAPVQLSTREWEVLAMLLAAKGEVVTKEKFLDVLWGAGTSSNVEVTIARLRKRIEQDPKNPELILTARRGYSYNVDHARD